MDEPESPEAGAPGAAFAAHLHHFVAPTLRARRAYAGESPDVPVKLHRNESPEDWPPDLKARVLSAVAARPWNRYPSPYAEDVADGVARGLGIGPGTILLAPGSNYLITLILVAFTRRDNQVVVPRPAFDWYGDYCDYIGVEHVPWPLGEDLEYDLSRLPPLSPGAVVMFPSPHNPAGSVLPSADLAGLLARHPASLFVADEAYGDFAGSSAVDLLSRFGNLLVLRTLTKSAAAAGIRGAYVAGSPLVITELKKLRPPFMLNHLALAAIEALLGDPDLEAFTRRARAQVIAERRRLTEALLGLGSAAIRIKASHANFLLIRWKDADRAEAAHRGLLARGVLVASFARFPMLEGALRVTVGTPAENDAFLSALQEVLAKDL